MQYELRYQVLETRRSTYQPLIERFGDQPASRYLEATVDIEPTENFHYRPTWIEDRELYDARFSALRLTDPYSFLDPRQYFYTPYVTNRSTLHEELGNTIDYLEERDLLAKLPDTWRSALTDIVLPLRHYEAGAQLVSVAGARFAHGTSIEQCCTFAAFDRIGNAQMISRFGLALGGGTKEALTAAKEQWMTAEALQPLRRLTEEIMITTDWAEGVLAIDLVDRLLFPLMYRDLDEASLLDGAGSYSLFAQHLNRWFGDQRRWIDALIAAWLVDKTYRDENRQVLEQIDATWGERAAEAVGALACDLDGRLDTSLSAATVERAAADSLVKETAA